MEPNDVPVPDDLFDDEDELGIPDNSDLQIIEDIIFDIKDPYFN